MPYCSSDNCHLHCDGTETLLCPTIENLLTYNLRHDPYCDLLLADDKCLINNQCRSQCIKAHRNLIKVATFISEDTPHTWLLENYISNININVLDKNGNSQYWYGAAWSREGQAFFGQHYRINQQLFSFAIALDVVAHEFFHGVTMQTADLEYAKESGALNESYSDIFAVLVANFDEPDIGKWQWEIGQGFGEDGGAIRSLSHPEIYDQPRYFHEYDYDLKGYDYPCKQNDYGNVHKNSGIHNKAAFNLLTSQDSNGKYLFDAASGVNLFYSALFRLGETSPFIDSYRAVKKVAKRLFGDDSNKEEKLAAIDRAFNSVGIYDSNTNNFLKRFFEMVIMFFRR